jgi:hypothetical protein
MLVLTKPGGGFDPRPRRKKGRACLPALKIVGQP